MDVWVVAAAAAAGYIAQHWKDLMKGGQSISVSSSGSSSFANPEPPWSVQQFQGKSCHIHRLGQRRNLGNDISETEPISQNASMAEVPSSNGIDGEKVVIMENYEDCNVLSQTCLSPRFLSNDKLGDFSECSSDLPLTPSTREVGSSYNRRILRSKRTNVQVIKPLNSLQSCLMAQLYKEHAEMEEYMLSSIPSPSAPTVRPLLVTDGSRIISRASGLSKNVRTRIGEGKLDNETGSEEKRAVLGVPPLLIPGRNREFMTRRDWGRKLSNSTKVIGAKYSNSKGSSHGALLFCLGISVGLMSSLLSNKREVDKLNNLLKQTEDLVQDLQEELELKDSFTVKELAHQDFESLDTNEDIDSEEALLVFSSEHNCDESSKKDQKEDHDQKTQEESMRKIEAELEAELARLEINMNSSTLEGQFPDLVEVDPDSLPDVAQGELRADMFGRQTDDQPYADRDGSGSSTPHFINYAVSPRELTIRLHEVLASRLEERVKELETALQNSGKKVRYTETECAESWRVFSNSEAGSSSIQGSPPIAKEEDLAEQPVVIHLSGDALHAYNEASDELTKVDGSEEGLPSGVENVHQESLHNFDQDLLWTENGGLNSYNSLHSITTRSGSLALGHRGEEDHSTSSNGTSTSGHEDESSEDEMERYLIKQILEKTRQGSPAVLKARKILFSMDESEH